MRLWRSPFWFRPGGSSLRCGARTGLRRFVSFSSAEGMAWQSVANGAVVALVLGIWVAVAVGRALGGLVAVGGCVVGWVTWPRSRLDLFRPRLRVGEWCGWGVES